MSAFTVHENAMQILIALHMSKQPDMSRQEAQDMINEQVLDKTFSANLDWPVSIISTAQGKLQVVVRKPLEKTLAFRMKMGL